MEGIIIIGVGIIFIVWIFLAIHIISENVKVSKVIKPRLQTHDKLLSKTGESLERARTAAGIAKVSYSRLSDVQKEIYTFLNDDVEDTGKHMSVINELLKKYENLHDDAVLKRDQYFNAFNEASRDVQEFVSFQNSIGGADGSVNAIATENRRRELGEISSGMTGMPEDAYLLQKALLYVERHRKNRG